MSKRNQPQAYGSTLVRRCTAVALSLTLVAVAAAAMALENGRDAESALRELKAGNQHHVSHRYSHPHQSAARQRELVAGQHPHAVILSCSDSRVAPEIVFDQGLGDLFVVRVAGNVAGDVELASIEYAAEHLETPLVVVMGHQKCGAVSAAVAGGEAGGHLPALIGAIQPAVAKANGQAGDRVENSVRLNVEMIVERLRTSQPVLAELVHHGKLRIVGAVYSLDSGAITWLPESAAPQ